MVRPERLEMDCPDIQRLGLSLSAVTLLTTLGTGLAPSGGASLPCWVAFENVAYVGKPPTAKVVLRHDSPPSEIVYSTETDEHGFFNFPHLRPRPIQTGDYKGYEPYSADVYVPSDFAGNWAVELKAEVPKWPW